MTTDESITIRTATDDDWDAVALLDAHAFGEHQNAEYRITEDARLATDAPIDLVVGLLAAVLTAGCRHGICAPA